VTRNHPNAAEARFLAANRRKPIQSLGRGNRPRLGGISQGIDVGHLIQTQRLGFALREGHPLAAVVVKRDENRRRERNHPGVSHPVSRSSPPQQQLDLGRLLAARDIPLPEADHELQKDRGIRRWEGGDIFGLRDLRGQHTNGRRATLGI
jgi:hypothetical protein